nr:hypothetical protein CFP56_55000 [Quercus suber]
MSRDAPGKSVDRPSTQQPGEKRQKADQISPPFSLAVRSTRKQSDGKSNRSNSCPMLSSGGMAVSIECAAGCGIGRYGGGNVDDVRFKQNGTGQILPPSTSDDGSTLETGPPDLDS